MEFATEPPDISNRRAHGVEEGLELVLWMSDMAAFTRPSWRVHLVRICEIMSSIALRYR